MEASAAHTEFGQATEFVGTHLLVDDHYATHETITWVTEGCHHVELARIVESIGGRLNHDDAFETELGLQLAVVVSGCVWRLQHCVGRRLISCVVKMHVRVAGERPHC